MGFDLKFLLFMSFVATTLSRSVFLNDENYVSEEDYDEDEDYIDLSHLGSSAFGNPNPSIGQLVDKWNETSSLNPEELGSYFEGDILMETIEGRSAVVDKTRRWPGGIIPYEIDSIFPANKRQMIEEAVNTYNTKTCLRLKRRSGEQDYIKIKGASSGCWSSVGRVGGEQTVNVQVQGCMTTPGTILHEIMHAAGFLHEQNRPDRDSFVSINYNNIQSGMDSNFQKADSRQYTTLGVTYDYGSVMHYSPTAFSKNGQATIVALKSGGVNMGQRKGFSQADIARINDMYCKDGSKPSGGSSSGKPTGNKKKKPKPGSAGGIKPIKPIKPIQPIKPSRG